MRVRSPSTIPEVIERLRVLESTGPRRDGVACFARLYREVTVSVRADLAGRGFEDPHFLERLDVTFAGLFFSALDAYERDPAAAPRAWVPLFADRSSRGIAPLQFALAGMNAHINRDLPVALVTTCRGLGFDLSERTREHGDYEHVDLLLARVEERIKRSYLTGWLARVDRLVHRFHRIDDVVAMWDVGRARDAAWTNGQALWALDDDESLAQEFLLTLDRIVGLASRGLLVPADSFLQRLARAAIS